MEALVVAAAIVAHGVLTRPRRPVVRARPVVVESTERAPRRPFRRKPDRAEPAVTLPIGL